MKRLLSILLTFCLCSSFIFAEEYDEGDEYDDGYIYEQNGKGDQFLKIDLCGCFPLNFKDPVTKTVQLKPGFAFDGGYYRFLNNFFAVGAEASFTSNWSIGDKLCYIVPVTAGVMIQPFVGNFEFPIYAGIGIGYEAWASNKYFPSLAAKATAGAYYRITESWSVGASSSFLWIPQWFKDSSLNKNGLFLTANAGFRFHF